MDASYRIHRRLLVEELEPRIAPVLYKTVPYTQTFNGWAGGNAGWTYYSTAGGYLSLEPPGSTNDEALRMQSKSPSSTYDLNEAILHLNLNGESNVWLEFEHRDSYDEPNALPTGSWAGHQNGDGVAISDDDGATWHTILNLGRSLNWQTISIDMDQAVAAAGISYSSTFLVKFQQYDNQAWLGTSGDGREFDTVKLFTVVPGPVNYKEDFSSGKPTQGWEYYSDNAGRTQVVGGALRMDTSTNAYSLNEAIVTLNLTGQSDVKLQFDHRDNYDEFTAMPTGTWAGHQNGDGVAISADGGANWYSLTSLGRELSLTTHTIDLDAVMAGLGWTYTADFQIKFQQYDNLSWGGADGREFDNIWVIAAGAPTNFVLNADADGEAYYYYYGGSIASIIATDADADAVVTGTWNSGSGTYDIGVTNRLDSFQSVKANFTDFDVDDSIGTTGIASNVSGTFTVVSFGSSDVLNINGTLNSFTISGVGGLAGDIAANQITGTITTGAGGVTSTGSVTTTGNFANMTCAADMAGLLDVGGNIVGAVNTGPLSGVVDVTGSLTGSSAAIVVGTPGDDLAGTITIGQNIQNDAYIQVADEISGTGSITVGGNVTSTRGDGAIDVNGAVTSSGAYSIQIGGLLDSGASVQVYGSADSGAPIELLGAFNGTVRVGIDGAGLFGDVTVATNVSSDGTLRAYNDNNSATLTTDPTTAGQLLYHRDFDDYEDNDPDTLFGVGSDTVVLDPGDIFDYTDSDGDTVRITYDIASTGTVTVVFTGTSDPRDIDTITYASATATSDLDISVITVVGNGATTAGDVTATGQVFGTFTVDGWIESWTDGELASGEEISTNPGGALGDVGAISLENDIAGTIRVGNDVTDLISTSSSITGSIIVGNDLAAGVSAGVDIDGNITVSGSTTIGGSITAGTNIDGAINVTGSIGGAITATAGDLTGAIDAGVDIDAGIIIGGSTTSGGTITAGVNIDGAINVIGSIGGAITATAGNLNAPVSAGVDIDGDITVGGSTTFFGSILAGTNIDGAINVTGSIGGGITATVGDLTGAIDAGVDIDAGITVGGSTTAGGTITAGVNIDGAIFVVGSIGGAITATGGDLTGAINAGVDIDAIITIGGATTLFGTITAGVNIDGAIDVTGNIGGAITATTGNIMNTIHAGGDLQALISAPGGFIDSGLIDIDGIIDASNGGAVSVNIPGGAGTVTWTYYEGADTKTGTIVGLGGTGIQGTLLIGGAAGQEGGSSSAQARANLTLDQDATSLTTTGINFNDMDVQNITTIDIGSDIEGTLTMTSFDDGDTLTITGGTLNNMTISGSGGLGGDVVVDEVTGTITTGSGGVTADGSVTTTGDLADMTIGSDMAGQVTIGGSLTGSIAISGDITSAGAYSISVAGDLGLGAEITATGDASAGAEIRVLGEFGGLIRVGSGGAGLFGNVVIGTDVDSDGILRAYDRNGAATLTTDETTAGQLTYHRDFDVYEDNNPNTLFNWTTIETTLNPGDSYVFTDSDGDEVTITYGASSTGTVTVLFTAASGPRDIDTITYTAATDTSDLDISITNVVGNGATTAGDVDATGQTFGTFTVEGWIESWTGGTLASGEAVTTVGALGNVGDMSFEGDLAGLLDISSDLSGELDIAGDITGSASIGSVSGAILVSGDVAFGATVAIGAGSFRGGYMLIDGSNLGTITVNSVAQTYVEGDLNGGSTGTAPNPFDTITVLAADDLRLFWDGYTDVGYAVLYGSAGVSMIYADNHLNSIVAQNMNVDSIRVEGRIKAQSDVIVGDGVINSTGIGVDVGGNLGFLRVERFDHPDYSVQVGGNLGGVMVENGMIEGTITAGGNLTGAITTEEAGQEIRGNITIAGNISPTGAIMPGGDSTPGAGEDITGKISVGGYMAGRIYAYDLGKDIANGFDKDGNPQVWPLKGRIEVTGNITGAIDIVNTMKDYSYISSQGFIASATFSGTELTAGVRVQGLAGTGALPGGIVTRIALDDPFSWSFGVDSGTTTRTFSVATDLNYWYVYYLALDGRNLASSGWTLESPTISSPSAVTLTVWKAVLNAISYAGTAHTDTPLASLSNATISDYTTGADTLTVLNVGNLTMTATAAAMGAGDIMDIRNVVWGKIDLGARNMDGLIDIGGNLVYDADNGSDGWISTTGLIADFDGSTTGIRIQGLSTDTVMGGRISTALSDPTLAAVNDFIIGDDATTGTRSLTTSAMVLTGAPTFRLTLDGRFGTTGGWTLESPTLSLYGTGVLAESEWESTIRTANIQYDGGSAASGLSFEDVSGTASTFDVLDNDVTFFNLGTIAITGNGAIGAARTVNVMKTLYGTATIGTLADNNIAMAADAQLLIGGDLVGNLNFVAQVYGSDSAPDDKALIQIGGNFAQGAEIDYTPFAADHFRGDITVGGDWLGFFDINGLGTNIDRFGASGSYRGSLFTINGNFGSPTVTGTLFEIESGRWYMDSVGTAISGLRIGNDNTGIMYGDVRVRATAVGTAYGNFQSTRIHIGTASSTSGQAYMDHSAMFGANSYSSAAVYIYGGDDEDVLRGQILTGFNSYATGETIGLQGTIYVYGGMSEQAEVRALRVHDSFQSTGVYVGGIGTAFVFRNDVKGVIAVGDGYNSDDDADGVDDEALATFGRTFYLIASYTTTSPDFTGLVRTFGRGLVGSDFEGVYSYGYINIGGDVSGKIVGYYLPDIELVTAAKTFSGTIDVYEDFRGGGLRIAGTNSGTILVRGVEQTYYTGVVGANVPVTITTPNGNTLVWTGNTVTTTYSYLYANADGDYIPMFRVEGAKDTRSLVGTGVKLGSFYSEGTLVFSTGAPIIDMNDRIDGSNEYDSALQSVRLNTFPSAASIQVEGELGQVIAHLATVNTYFQGDVTTTVGSVGTNADLSGYISTYGASSDFDSNSQISIAGDGRLRSGLLSLRHLIGNSFEILGDMDGWIYAANNTVTPIIHIGGDMNNRLTFPGTTAAFGGSLTIDGDFSSQMYIGDATGDTGANLTGSITIGGSMTPTSRIYIYGDLGITGTGSISVGDIQADTGNRGQILMDDGGIAGSVNVTNNMDGYIWAGNATADTAADLTGTIDIGGTMGGNIRTYGSSGISGQLTVDGAMTGTGIIRAYRGNVTSGGAYSISVGGMEAGTTIQIYGSAAAGSEIRVANATNDAEFDGTIRVGEDLAGTFGNVVIDSNAGSTGTLRAYNRNASAALNDNDSGATAGLLTYVRDVDTVTSFVRSTLFEEDNTVVLDPDGVNVYNFTDLDGDTVTVTYNGPSGSTVTLELSDAGVGQESIGSITYVGTVDDTSDLLVDVTGGTGAGATSGGTVTATGFTFGTFTIDGWVDRWNGGTLATGETITISGNLGGASSFEGDLDGDLDIGGSLNGTLAIAGDLDGTSLTVGGDVNAAISITGDVTGTVDITGALNSTITIDGAGGVTSTGSITVGNIPSTTGQIITSVGPMAGSITVNTGLGGYIYVGDDDTDTGADLSGTVQINGDMTGSGRVMIRGQGGITSTGLIDVNGNMVGSNTRIYTYNGPVAGTIDISTNMSGYVYVGDAEADTGADLSGSIHIGGDVTDSGRILIRGLGGITGTGSYDVDGSIVGSAALMYTYAGPIAGNVDVGVNFSGYIYAGDADTDTASDLSGTIHIGGDVTDSGRILLRGTGGITGTGVIDIDGSMLGGGTALIYTYNGPIDGAVDVGVDLSGYIYAGYSTADTNGDISGTINIGGDVLTTGRIYSFGTTGVSGAILIGGDFDGLMDIDGAVSGEIDITGTMVSSAALIDVGGPLASATFSGADLLTGLRIQGLAGTGVIPGRVRTAVDLNDTWTLDIGDDVDDSVRTLGYTNQSITGTAWITLDGRYLAASGWTNESPTLTITDAVTLAQLNSVISNLTYDGAGVTFVSVGGVTLSDFGIGTTGTLTLLNSGALTITESAGMGDSDLLTVANKVWGAIYVQNGAITTAAMSGTSAIVVNSDIISGGSVRLQGLLNSTNTAGAIWVKGDVYGDIRVDASDGTYVSADSSRIYVDGALRGSGQVYFSVTTGTIYCRTDIEVDGGIYDNARIYIGSRARNAYITTGPVTSTRSGGAIYTGYLYEVVTINGNVGAGADINLGSGMLTSTTNGQVIVNGDVETGAVIRTGYIATTGAGDEIDINGNMAGEIRITSTQSNTVAAAYALYSTATIDISGDLTGLINFNYTATNAGIVRGNITVGGDISGTGGIYVDRADVASTSTITVGGNITSTRSGGAMDLGKDFLGTITVNGDMASGSSIEIYGNAASGTMNLNGEFDGLIYVGQGGPGSFVAGTFGNVSIAGNAGSDGTLRAYADNDSAILTTGAITAEQLTYTRDIDSVSNNDPDTLFYWNSTLLDPGDNLVFTDQDGDSVTVTYDIASTGQVGLVFVPAGLGFDLRTIEYSGATAASDLSVLVTADVGDGMTGVGNVYAGGVDFGLFTLDGWITTWWGDLAGELDILGDVNSAMTITGDLAGTSLTVGGDLNAALTIGGNLTGTLTVTDALTSTITISGAGGVTSTGVISVGDMTASASKITLSQGPMQGTINVAGSELGGGIYVGDATTDNAADISGTIGIAGQLASTARVYAYGAGGVTGTGLISVGGGIVSGAQIRTTQGGMAGVIEIGGDVYGTTAIFIGDAAADTAADLSGTIRITSGTSDPGLYGYIYVYGAGGVTGTGRIEIDGVFSGGTAARIYTFEGPMAGTIDIGSSDNMTGYIQIGDADVDSGADLSGEIHMGGAMTDSGRILVYGQNGISGLIDIGGGMLGTNALIRTYNGPISGEVNIGGDLSGYIWAGNATTDAGANLSGTISVSGQLLSTAQIYAYGAGGITGTGLIDVLGGGMAASGIIRATEGPIAGTINIGGNAAGLIWAGNAVTDSAANLSGTINVSGQLASTAQVYVYGASGITGEINVAGSGGIAIVSGGRILTLVGGMSGAISLGGNVNGSTAIYIGDATTDTGADLSGTISITGGGNLLGGVRVYGNNGITSTGAIEIAGNLGTGGSIRTYNTWGAMAGSITIGGDISSAATDGIYIGDATTDTGANISGTISVGGQLASTARIYAYGTGGITGTGEINVTGSGGTAIVSGGLIRPLEGGMAGTMTFGGDVYGDGALWFGDATTDTGANLSGTINLTGGASLYGGIRVYGTTGISSSGAIVIGGNMATSSTNIGYIRTYGTGSDLAGTIDVGGNLQNTAYIQIVDDITASGSLTIGGNVSATGTAATGGVAIYLGDAMSGTLTITGELSSTVDIGGTAVSGNKIDIGSMTSTGKLLAAVFGDVEIYGNFEGQIGDGGTADDFGTLYIHSSGNTIAGQVIKAGSLQPVTGEDLTFGGAFAVIDDVDTP